MSRVANYSLLLLTLVTLVTGCASSQKHEHTIVRAVQDYFSGDYGAAANKLAPGVPYMHRGGKLGIWLKDLKYGDNVEGEGGRNPRWELSGQVTCE